MIGYGLLVGHAASLGPAGDGWQAYDRLFRSRTPVTCQWDQINSAFWQLTVNSQGSRNSQPTATVRSTGPCTGRRWVTRSVLPLMMVGASTTTDRPREPTNVDGGTSAETVGRPTVPRGRAVAMRQEGADQPVTIITVIRHFLSYFLL